MTSFSIQTFGCRVNQAEAFGWSDVLQTHGLAYEEDSSRSDFVIVNTCSLTSRADRDARSFIRKIARANPDARLVLTGCYVERAPGELPDVPQIWRVFSNTDKEKLVSEILSASPAEKRRLFHAYRSRALVKIQDGCSLRCTFCVVPGLRGKSRSVPEERILSQVRELIRRGYREMVLTGVHICLYGRELRPRSSLLHLIKEVECLDDFGHLRLSSLDPRFLGKSLLDHITSSPFLRPHFHFSLQHGSDEILQRMGRKSRVADYERILSQAAGRSPSAAMGADIIAGFPGESEREFEETFRFLERSPLTYFHVFSYSPRPGTPASEWPQVEEKIKKERAARLKRLSRMKNLEFRRQLPGKEWEAVVIRKNGQSAQVLTENYVRVDVPACREDAGEELRIRITRVTDSRTEGEAL